MKCLCNRVKNEGLEIEIREKKNICSRKHKYNIRIRLTELRYDEGVNDRNAIQGKAFWIKIFYQ